MPPIPSNATDEQFRRASYMVEVYWLAVVYNRISGTMIYMSSAASNFLKDWRYFEVFFIPSVAPASILGRCREGTHLGYVKDYCPAGVGGGDMRLYMEKQYPGTPKYHGWCGYSQDNHTPDGRYHACDWYWQDSSMYMSGTYNWYILRDVVEPSLWYETRLVLLRGTRDMPDTSYSRV